MTSTVIHMTHSVDRELITRLFSKFASKYGKLWTTRLGEGGDWASCADDWFQELSKFSLEQVRTAVNKALTIHRDFPPTQGQIIDLCLSESGVPSVNQLINLMVVRDFSHPLVKMVYDKIGSWTLTNGKEAEIQSKAKAAYDQCSAEFQLEPELCWAKLTAFHDKPKELPAPPKIPTAQESRGFKERMEEFQRLAEEGKASLQDMKPMEFDEKEIRGEGKQRKEYEAYLLSVPERLVLGLPPKYAYDRQRLLNLQETPKHLKEVGYVPPKEREGFASPISSNRSGAGKPVKVYKNWAHD